MLNHINVPFRQCFHCDNFHTQGMASLVLKTGNQSNSLLSYPLPLPVLCKEQMQNVQAHVLRNPVWHHKQVQEVVHGIKVYWYKYVKGNSF